MFVFFGPDNASPLAHAVRLYDLNGGSAAVILRIPGKQEAAATATLPTNGPVLQAISSGGWGVNLQARVDYAAPAEEKPKDPRKKPTYNLSIRDSATGLVERYPAVSTDPVSQRTLPRLLRGSRLATVTSRPLEFPKAHDAIKPGEDPWDTHLGPVQMPQAADPGIGPPPPPAPQSNKFSAFTLPAEALNSRPNKDDYAPADAENGIFLLNGHDVFFNILVVAPFADGSDVPPDVLAQAAALAVAKRAVMLVDASADWTSTEVALQRRQDFDVFGESQRNCAIYYPRLDLGDTGLVDTSNFPASGAVAGLIASTDRARGIWKAPAGIETRIAGALRLTEVLDNFDSGRLNPEGINALRALPEIGMVIWGARTMDGADILTSDWKYLPIRRLALYIEESLYRGTQWVVFEPNDEPLWGQIRLNVGAFMHTLFRQGAFQGASARDAYFVKCDSDTTPQADIDRGIVNILVGFAPLKPAEFVIIQLQQIAGQIEV